MISCEYTHFYQPFGIFYDQSSDTNFRCLNNLTKLADNLAMLYIQILHHIFNVCVFRNEVIQSIKEIVSISCNEASEVIEDEIETVKGSGCSKNECNDEIEDQ